MAVLSPLTEETRVDPLYFLRNRRSMTKATDEPVDRSLVEQVIEAATWAPNHRRTEPWRFVVIAGAEREKLGLVLERIYRRRLSERGETPTEEGLTKERNKPLRAPVVIAVASEPSDDPRTIEVEEIAATAAGIENMLLAAQALGLGAMWRTGDIAYDPELRDYFGFLPRAQVLAFVYLGHPEIVPPISRQGDFRRHIRWMGEQ